MDIIEAIKTTMEIRLLTTAHGNMKTKAKTRPLQWRRS